MTPVAVSCLGAIGKEALFYRWDGYASSTLAESDLHMERACPIVSTGKPRLRDTEAEQESEFKALSVAILEALIQRQGAVVYPQVQRTVHPGGAPSSTQEETTYREQGNGWSKVAEFNNRQPIWAYGLMSASWQIF